jgi:hypothetical protein
MYDTAHMVQNAFGAMLKPPKAGLYLPNQLEPVLVEGGTYWYEKPVLQQGFDAPKTAINMEPTEVYTYTGKAIVGDVLSGRQAAPWQYYRYEYQPVFSLEQVPYMPWDVIDINPDFDPRPKRVLLPHHLGKTASLFPDMPVMGMKVAMAIVQHDINSSRAFANRTAVLLEEVVLPFLQLPTLSRHVRPVDHLRQDRWFQDTLSLVFDGMLTVISPIRDLIRHNPFQICTITVHDGYQLRIDQLGDYRIREWETITGDPEYQRWLQARTNGDWDRYVGEQEDLASNNYAQAIINNPYR